MRENNREPQREVNREILLRNNTRGSLAEEVTVVLRL